MNAQRYQQVKQIFLAACQWEPGQVAALLDQACAGDPELRREVESLLEHHRTGTIAGKSPADILSEQTQTLLRPPLAEPAIESSSRLERFPPGSVLAGRYRMIGSLGRGGMGEVYRADDLKLDQAVALKFLPPGRSQSPDWIRRYQNEVRLARRVTHPNVMRVYDISEAEGEVFISMEYVDGEDLAALLRRVGRLTVDKTMQIARQLCAGLGAAHDRGVLHRDLKPANIMIDGRGQVRIADFGIAALASQAEQPGRLAGTPGFMAPELFAGGKPSIQSDLYSLGLVLYQALAGKEPFAGASGEIRARDATPLRLAAILPEIDARFEQVILQCLAGDPKRRPDSAYAVAAALPGGDALAMALAAGETPSPSMVAAASPSGALTPRVAVGYLTVALVALFFVVRLADQTFFLPRAGLVKPPAVLADKAEQIVAMLRHAPKGQEHWQGFAIDRGYLQYAADAEDRHRTWEDLPSGRPPAVCYWYRAGSDRLALPALMGEPSPMREFPTDPGMVMVRLDGRGRLLQYVVMPDRSGFSDASFGPLDWSALFELAGLPITKFKPIPPPCRPPMYADSLAAWQGTYAENPQMPIRVEGASLDGRAVFFEVLPPWAPDWTDAEEGPSRLPRRMPNLRLMLYLLTVLGGGFLAWQNARLGRGDHRGARRLVVFVLFLGLLDWLLGERHVPILTEEIALFYSWMARATLTAAIAWIAYFAGEPYVRRFWPQILITWNRLLEGKFHDPLVGRDILIGGLCGILLVLVMQLDVLLSARLGALPPLPKLPATPYDLGAVLGLRYKLSILVTALMTSITLALVLPLLMLALRALLRVPWLSTAAFWLLLTALQTHAAGQDASFPWLISALAAGLAIVLLMHLGLVALIGALFVWFVIMSSPITADLHAWYAPASGFALFSTVALLAYGFFTARRGQPILWQRWLDG